MRDPKRIEELLALLQEIWQQSPDLRFNQLIYNLQYDYSKSNNGVGLVQEESESGITRKGFDLFNLEDKYFIEFLKTQLSSEH